jgi:hypothetical protein
MGGAIAGAVGGVAALALLIVAYCQWEALASLCGKLCGKGEKKETSSQPANITLNITNANTSDKATANADAL